MIAHAELMARLRVALAGEPLTTRQLCPLVRMGYVVLTRRLSRLLKQGDVVAKRRMEPGWCAKIVRLWSLPVRVKFARDVADDIEVERQRIAPAANMVFSPNELEARIEVYAEIAAQGLSIFGDEAEEDEPPKNECWGCGCKPPMRENGWRMMPARTPGWVLIPLVMNKHLSEIWCPECAAMPGFGCVEDPEPYEWGDE